MGTATLRQTAVDPHRIMAQLSEKLQGSRRALQPWMDSSAGARQEAARAFSDHRDPDGLAMFRLRESVAHHLLGNEEQAFVAAHEAWALVDGRAIGSVQALVLTQVAACGRIRDDLRAAIRAARRSEALIVAAAGEETPQTLAVRAQLLSLLQERGMDSESVAARRDQTIERIWSGARDTRKVMRYRRLVEVFVGRGQPPHWALNWCLSWRNVFAG